MVTPTHLRQRRPTGRAKQQTGIRTKASPWQRPSNENTNGLLRDYFPKGSDLRVHDADRLGDVAAEVNERPRKTLGWATPARLLQQFTREPTG